MTENPAADWYPDPRDANAVRYWYGTAWTEHTAPAPTARPASTDVVRDPHALGVAAVVLAVLLTVAWIVIAALSAEGERTYVEMAETGAVDFAAYDVASFLYLPIAIATYVVTCLWLWRVRVNVELRRSVEHARKRGWIWAGWLVPAVSLWFPFQIVRDVSSVPGTSTTAARPAVGLGPWWAC